MKDPNPTQTAAGRTNSDWMARMLAGREALVEWLCARTGVSRWELSRERFAEALARSAAKKFAERAPSAQELEEYLRELHAEDLALACACAAGHGAAWEYFVSAYRGGLRAAAGAVLGRSAQSPEAQELADSLFAELYGVDARGRSRESLFRYYHGRSKLSTWLRAVLAQRHVDAIRQSRRFEAIEEKEQGEQDRKPAGAPAAPMLDPDRARYLTLLRRAFDAALARLNPRDRERLALYYAEEQTLAEIGRRLGEHESSVSRNLERIRTELRHAVEDFLRSGEGAADGAAARGGLSEAQIALCFEYAVEDAPVDLQQSLGPSRRASAEGRKR